MVSIVFYLGLHGCNQGHSCGQETLRGMQNALFAFVLGKQMINTLNHVAAARLRVLIALTWD